MTRDLTEKQYVAKMKKHGFKPMMMGYWCLAAPHESTHVYAANGGDRYRDRLSYMIKKQQTIYS